MFRFRTGRGSRARRQRAAAWMQGRFRSAVGGLSPTELAHLQLTKAGLLSFPGLAELTELAKLAELAVVELAELAELAD